MNRRFVMGAVAVLTIVLSAAEAKAATIVLDFSSALYNGANGVSNFATVDQGVAVTVSTSTGTLQHNAQGFGVNSSVIGEDPNEVGLRELMLTGFAPSQYVESVSFERFFIDEPLTFGHDEVGQYQINGGAWVSFFSNSATGLYTLNLGQGGVTSLGFRGTNNLLINDDFAVRSVSLQSTAVPEPATMILLGSGLAGAYMQRRRKKNQEV